MDVRALGPVAGLLGGLCWVVRWVMDLAGGTPDWAGSLYWAGFALLLVAAGVVGASLVSRSALWLRVLVAVAFPLLAWSIYSVVRGEGEALGVDGAVGLLAVVLSGVAVAAGRRTSAPDVARGHRHGSHAAR